MEGTESVVIWTKIKHFLNLRPLRKAGMRHEFHELTRYHEFFVMDQ